MRCSPDQAAIVFSVLALAAIGRAEAPAGFQATNWDRSISLPPDAYRAAKPIQLNGDFPVKIQPGSLLEGVKFEARSGVQHWQIEGSLLRQVQLSGKRNSSGRAVDSVFEGFRFWKDDNWYNFWWSTQWKFTNCIFTEKFLRDTLEPLDYSAQATRCTFYSVKLPNIGFKENPAGYLQTEHMMFDQCRFVDCDVPQTFLAATVNCVFESCRFSPKGATKWPKETTPIKVTAYYDGTDSEPASFLNGPLDVEFARAPSGVVYGSTMPHTRSGSRITLPSLRLSGQFAQLGSVDRKASEFVDPSPAAPSPPAAAAPVVTAPAPVVPVIAANGPPVHTPEEMLRAMPANVEVMAAAGPNPAGIAAANLWLARTYANHAAALRLTLESIMPNANEGYAFMAVGRPQSVLYHGAAIPSRAVAMFRQANAAPLSSIPRNTDFAVSGLVRKAEFVARGESLAFMVTVGEAQTGAPAPVAPAPSVAAAPSAGDQEGQLVGEWAIFAWPGGGHWTQTIAADHTYWRDGRKIATWEVKDHQFLVRYDDGAGTNAYDLPVRDGVLTGTNLRGSTLILTRVGQPTPPALVAQLAGAWYRRDNSNSAPAEPIAFQPDGIYFSSIGHSGRWRVFGDHLVVDYENPAFAYDVYQLPVTDDTLTGKRLKHSILTLTRQPGAAPAPGSGDKSQDTYFGSH